MGERRSGEAFDETAETDATVPQKYLERALGSVYAYVLA
jgi:hypothetical protein